MVILVESIETLLFIDKQENHHTSSQSQGEAKYINQAIELVLANIPKGGDDIIFEHSFGSRLE